MTKATLAGAGMAGAGIFLAAAAGAGMAGAGSTQQ